MNRSPSISHALLRILSAAAVLAVVMGAGLIGPAEATPRGTSIGGDLYMTGATITGDGPDSGRELDSYQAAAFMQSWFVPSLVQDPIFGDPPPEAVHYAVTVGYDASENGNTIVLGIPPEQAVGEFVVNYATTGSQAWLSLPQEALWPGAGIDADHADKWFVADQTTIDAFNGRGTVQDTADAATSKDGISEDAAATSAASSGTGSSVVIIALVGGLIVLLAVAIVVSRRRTRTD